MSANSRSLAMLALIAAAIAWAVALSSPQFVGPRREYSGVYRTNFESSYFVEGANATTEPAFNLNTIGTLEGVSITLPPEQCGRSVTLEKRFEIHFIGRRKPGPAGHLGASPAEYLVERVIDIRPLDQDC